MSAIHELAFNIPIPTTNIQLYWLLMGMLFAYSFGSKLDYEIQKTRWFKNLIPFNKYIVKSFLDFFHHWWIGFGFFLYAESIALAFQQPHIVEELMFFGLGIFIDDIRDYQHLIERYKKLFEESNDNEDELPAPPN